MSFTDINISRARDIKLSVRECAPPGCPSISVLKLKLMSADNEMQVNLFTDHASLGRLEKAVAAFNEIMAGHEIAVEAA
jgi:hypothetical protein